MLADAGQEGIAAFDAVDQPVLDQEIERAIDRDRRRPRPLAGHALHDLVGAERAVAFGQRLQHLAAERREPLAAGGAQRLGMRHGLGAAAAMVVIGRRKDSRHGVGFTELGAAFQSRHSDRSSVIHENRSHAAWRETPSASPIVAQLTSRARSVSTASCNRARALSKMTPWTFSRLISRSVGMAETSSNLTIGVGSSAGWPMILLQRPTHSSQMNTVGPAMSFATLCWLLPQNEQWSVGCSPLRRDHGKRDAAFLSLPLRVMAPPVSRLP